MHAGQFNFGSANDGAGYELTAIAAVVIGGTSLFGGAGTMIGTIAGSIMLGALANILQLNNINAALQLLATGAIIVLAAVLQAIVGRREGDALRPGDSRKRPRRTSKEIQIEGGLCHEYAEPSLVQTAALRRRAGAAGRTGAGRRPLVKDCGKDGKYVIGFSQANYAEPYRQHVNNDLIALAKAVPQFSCRSPTAPATTTRRPRRSTISSPRRSICC